MTCKWKEEHGQGCVGSFNSMGTYFDKCPHLGKDSACIAQEKESVNGHICMWADEDGRCSEEMRKICPEALINPESAECPYVKDVKELAKGGYERFRLSLKGSCLSDWQALPKDTQTAWEAAVVHIRKESIG